MKNQEGLVNRGRAVLRGVAGGTAEFPPSRQSSSYIPIRGWHSLISHIITLVRGALRSLAGYARRGEGGRRFGCGGETTGGGSWLFLCQACLWGTDLRPPWVLIHRSPPPPPGGCSCPNGPAPPRVRASAKQPRATPHVRSFEGGLASCNGLLAALNFELVIITLWAPRAPRLYRSTRPEFRGKRLFRETLMPFHSRKEDGGKSHEDVLIKPVYTKYVLIAIGNSSNYQRLINDNS